MGVEGDLLGDHGFALGDHLRAGIAADRQDRGPCLFRRLRPVQMSAGGDKPFLVAFQIEIEVVQRYDS